MSVQFGRWNFDGQTTTPDYMARAITILAPYGPDGRQQFAGSEVQILYFPFHTTMESRPEVQPFVSPTGAVFTWDGRLDNRHELIRALGHRLPTDATDVAIVAEAYARWGISCFAKLLGDWALAVWEPRERALVLAKDFLGSHHLYYVLDENHITWSTLLDPLVVLSEKPLEVEKEYVAGWLSFFPATHLAPYRGIHSLPPASFLHLRDSQATTREYWKLDPGTRIRYRTDAEYEEHFRAVFSEAVRRRLRSDAPVLAELSGGLDSSSIVCMADRLLAAGLTESPRLDTVSYYNDSEPNWNERPYFAKVEEIRGRVGCHIDVQRRDSEFSSNPADRTSFLPGSTGSSVAIAAQFANCIRSQGNRVLLSGIGGDEVLGGVPTPMPELADLFASGRIQEFARRLTVWALHKRRPWAHLLLDILREFLPPFLLPAENRSQPPAWLDSDFVKTYSLAFAGYAKRTTLSGPLPSFQFRLSALNRLRRQLGCSTQPCAPLYERRYPYLDRTLFEFLCAVPSEQLVRPGHRRSLMRRALVGIVPEMVLNRRRKAFVCRNPVVALEQWRTFLEAQNALRTEALGLLSSERLFMAIGHLSSSDGSALVPLLRTIQIEVWLSSLQNTGVMRQGVPPVASSPLPYVTTTTAATRKSFS